MNKHSSDINLYKELCADQACEEEEFIKEILTKSELTGSLNIAGKTLNTNLCQIIAQILKKSRVIRKIDFSDCMLNQDGLNFIIESIIHSELITELNFFGNNIKGEIVKRLGKLLSENTSLKSMNLKWNNLGLSLESFVIFCNGLARNENLEKLDLRNNRLCKDCAVHLGNALKANTNLKILDLRWNKLQNTGAECLLEALDSNKTLVSLNLKGNLVNREIMIALEHRLKSHNDVNRINMECKTKIDNLMVKIKSIEETHSQQLIIVQEASEKCLVETNKRFVNISKDLERNLKIIQEYESKTSSLASSLSSEKNRSENLEKALNERDATYRELLASHQSSMETIKESLHERDVELDRVTKILNENSLKEKETFSKIHKELTEEKLKNTSLKDEIDWLKNKMESVIRLKTETLEIDRDMWRKKYDELEMSSNAQIQRLKAHTLDKQQSLENTIMELSDKHACQIQTLTERYDRLKRDETLLQEQLAMLQNSVSSLQRENSSLIMQLEEPTKKITALLEEVSQERANCEKLKQQRIHNENSIHGLQSEIEKLNTELFSMRKQLATTEIKLEEEIVKLKEKNKHLQNQLQYKHRKIADIRKEEKERVKSLHHAVKNYLEKLVPSLIEEG